MYLANHNPSYTNRCSLPNSLVKNTKELGKETQKELLKANIPAARIANLSILEELIHKNKTP